MTTTAQNCISGTLTPYANWGANNNSPDPALAKKRDIQHLFSRMTFGANLLDINWALTKTPSEVVDTLVDLAVGETNVPTPGLDVHKWGNIRQAYDTELQATGNNHANRLSSLSVEWTDGMIGKNSPNDSILQQEIDRAKRFKYKMSLFWHNHFVVNWIQTAGNDITLIMWYKYTLIYHAVGNFKTFTEDIGLCQAMLFYLNASSNVYLQEPNWEPNENYARELLELFTMGAAGNTDPTTDYSQQDIEELAKVFSGWRAEFWSPETAKFREYIFQPNLHYWGTKQIFGQDITPNLPPSSVDTTSNNPNFDIAWPNHGPNICDHPLVYCGNRNDFGIKEAYDEYEEVHDIIFGKRNGVIISAARQERIAKFICGKIYKEFVYEEIDEDLVNELATIFINNNWELAPVLKALFKSEHFFSAAARGAQIQSHHGAFVSLYTTLGLEYLVDYFPSPRFFDPQYDPNDPYGYIDWTTPSQVAGNRVVYPDIFHSIFEMGHNLFQPPNVAGWPGHRTWINEYTLFKLGEELGRHIQNNFNDTRTPTKQRWRELMKALVDPAYYNNPDKVARAVIQHFILVDLLPEDEANAVAAFIGAIPNNQYEIWSLDETLYPAPGAEDFISQNFIALMAHILSLPENFMT